jgi:hypothetical protein
MTGDYRRHHAHAPGTVVVLVPVPRSPKSVHTSKPKPYPHQDRQHWRPATKPPSKGEKLARYMDAMRKQENDVRSFMDAARASSHAPNC